MELSRILYGDVLEAYSTGAFGAPQRSEQGKQMLEELNVREVFGPLSETERERQRCLEDTFCTNPTPRRKRSEQWEAARAKLTDEDWTVLREDFR